MPGAREVGGAGWVDWEVGALWWGGGRTVGGAGVGAAHSGARVEWDPEEASRNCSGCHWAAAGIWGRRRLTHAALAVRRALEASMARALEGTNDVDTLAVRTQAVTQGTLVDVCGVGGSTRLVGFPGEGRTCTLCLFVMRHT